LVLYYLISVSNKYKSLYFDGNEIIIYLKSLDYCFKNYSIKSNIKKKERTVEYIRTNKKRNIERLLESKDSIL
jgi:hypothetical protein